MYPDAPANLEIQVNQEGLDKPELLEKMQPTARAQHEVQAAAEMEVVIMQARHQHLHRKVIELPI